MLNSILGSNMGSIDLISVIICSLVSLVLGFIISLIYKITSRYNKNFLVTISILPLLVESVILMVSGSVGASIATLGAFSLVRFRSIPGTSKEILVVFFSMAIGLSTGMGHIWLAMIITLIGSLALLLFNKIKVFDNDLYEKVLKITIPENLDYTDIFKEEFDKYTKKVELVKVKTINMGSLFEVTYNVVMNKDVNEKDFLDDLRIKNGNLKLILSQPLSNGEL